MTTDQTPRRPDVGRVSGRELADTLADVLADQSKKAQSFREPSKGKARGKASPLAWVALVVFSGLAGVVWFAPPAWLDPTPAPLSPGLAEAGLRLEVYQQALLVEQFLNDRGRLPNDLAEAGVPSSKLEYQKIDAGRYRLTLSGPVASVEYVSTDSLATFLGDAFQIIRLGG